MDRPSGILNRMKQPAAEPTTKRSVDVTGLPDEAVRALESLVSLLKKEHSQDAAGGSTSSHEKWQELFDGWMREVAGRSSRYPPDFVLDDSRETLYGGRGE
jgi:hypothetical protein